MSNPIRVATAALSGQIFAGRPTKDGLGFKEPRYDVTSDVLKAVVDKIGIGFQTDIVSDGKVVCTIKIVGPDAPTPRETADHIGEANEKVTDHIGDATTMIDHAELARLAEAATPGPWDRMAGRGLVRAIRDDLAVPLFEPLEPYSDPLLDAPTCRVGGEVVFRANSQAARESAAIRQAVHNAAFIAAANPDVVLALLSEIAALRGERRNIVSHATMGATDGEGLTLNGVSVEITRLRNAMHSSYHDRATQAERQRDELRKALDYARYHVLQSPCSDKQACLDQIDQAITNQGADQ